MSSSNYSMYSYQQNWNMSPPLASTSLDEVYPPYDIAPQYQQCAYPLVHTAMYEAPLPPASPPTDGIHRVPCRWDSNCGIMLDDLSAAGLMRHIKEYHIRDSWNKKSRGVCKWDSKCGREMAYASYGKHVAVVHLRGTVQCPYCQKDVKRPGLLERHVKNYCQHAGSAKHTS